ncbi:MAG: hypothetical protein PHZ19_07715, partial [Candidatus Thermoplasmatota archaeon]|nr:hypothetical protein [Candidatus Thermoplasmatota archaeon]
MVVALSVMAAPAGAAWDKLISPVDASPSIESGLQHLAEQAQRRPATGAVEGLAASEVRVVVEASVLDPPAVAALGGTISHAAERFGLWEVRLPAERLLDLANLPSVRYVRYPSRPLPLMVTQGVSVTGAASWHRATCT